MGLGEMAPLERIRKKKEASVSDTVKPGSLCGWVPEETLHTACKALDKSVSLYEPHKHMAYKVRVILLMTVLHGHDEGPMKKKSDHR